MNLAVNLVNIEPAEHAMLSTLIAVICDPELANARRQLNEGRLALAIDADDVSWIDPSGLLNPPVDLDPEDEKEVCRE